jgi:hypothetical protein
MIQNRLVRLEKQNRFLKGAFALLAIAGITVAAAAPVEVLKDEPVKSSLTLVSPDGKNTITLRATNSLSGLWISRGANDPQVAIYQTQREAVLGLYGDRTNRETKACDVAVAVSNIGEPTIQVVNSENEPVVKSLISVLKK